MCAATRPWCFPHDLSVARRKVAALLERGLPHLRNGLRYRGAAEKASDKGYEAPAQMIVGRAEGDYVWDLDDNRYIDFQGGWATNPLGNCHPEIIEAVHAGPPALWLSVGTPAAHTAGGEAGRPDARQGLPRFSFEVSGTEAVESAIHLALCHTKRRYIISFTSCFHGEGLGTKMVSAYNSDNNLYMEAWAGGVLKAPFPYSENIPAGMSHAQYWNTACGTWKPTCRSLWCRRRISPPFLSSPVWQRGATGFPAVTFFRACAASATSTTGLMIADEVLTGLGRTGKDVGSGALRCGARYPGGRQEYVRRCRALRRSSRAGRYSR